MIFSGKLYGVQINKQKLIKGIKITCKYYPLRYACKTDYFYRLKQISAIIDLVQNKNTCS